MIPARSSTGSSAKTVASMSVPAISDISCADNAGVTAAAGETTDEMGVGVAIIGDVAQAEACRADDECSAESPPGCNDNAIASQSSSSSSQF
jgi:hypothetical protein